jgi:ankyrin repeat protein
MAAVNKNQDEFVEWLLWQGAFVHARMSTGWTALHAAAKNNNKNIIKLLLAKGASLTVTANHREFGLDLVPADLTCEQETLDLLK